MQPALFILRTCDGNRAMDAKKRTAADVVPARRQKVNWTLEMGKRKRDGAGGHAPTRVDMGLRIVD